MENFTILEAIGFITVYIACFVFWLFTGVVLARFIVEKSGVSWELGGVKAYLSFFIGFGFVLIGTLFSPCFWILYGIYKIPDVVYYLLRKHLAWR